MTTTPAAPGRRTLRASGSGWTTPSDVEGALRRAWETALSDHLAGRPFQPLDVTVRHPTARDVVARYDAARDWAQQWARRSTAGWTVGYRAVGGRTSGTNTVVHRVAVESFDALVRVLRTAPDVHLVEELRRLTRERVPTAVAWLTAHPGRVLALADDWEPLLAAVAWIAGRDVTGRYLRHVDAPGVDTKFLAAHRGVLGELLEAVLPPDRLDLTAPRGDVEGRLRLRRKPVRVRVRLLDEAAAWAGGLRDLEVPLGDLAATPVPLPTVLVVENETTFLALPPLPGTAAVFGSGWSAPVLGGIPWLDDRRLLYWGDLDTHGFAILDGLRSHHPHARSVLMDTATLLDHRAHWDVEPAPTARELTRLDSAEQVTYDALRAGVHAPRLRLEQERIRFGYARDALLASVG